MQVRDERYDGIDGVKALAIVGIVLTHVLYNGNYELTGFVFERLIPAFTDLVFLFMMVSGFGICCGYYQKIVDQKISLEEFYKKRYIKIWPYFALLCGLDFVISPSKESLFEVFANLTLCQGLLPNANITVIGVSWTLAVIFVFYLLFPFFCFLLGNRKRAWFTFACAVFFNYACSVYFFDANHIVDRAVVNFRARTNIVYDAVFFITGGLIFLYREEIAEFSSRHKVAVGAMILAAVAVYFGIGSSTVTMMFLCVMILVYTLGCKRGGMLVNSVTRFLGSICFEIYLCHMVVFRTMEKMRFVLFCENDLLAYSFNAVAVIGGSIVFSVCVKWLIGKAEVLLKKRAAGIAK